MKKPETVDVTFVESAATLNSFQRSKLSKEGKMVTADVTVTDGSVTTRTVQTLEGSLEERAEATDLKNYLKGWRLHFLSLRSSLRKSSSSSHQADEGRSVSLLFFLVNIEVSIVGTSLISITDDLHSFKQGGWVVTGYLITYTGKTGPNGNGSMIPLAHHAE